MVQGMARRAFAGRRAAIVAGVALLIGACVVVGKNGRLICEIG